MPKQIKSETSAPKIVPAGSNWESLEAAMDVAKHYMRITYLVHLGACHSVYSHESDSGIQDTIGWWNDELKDAADRLADEFNAARENLEGKGAA